MYEGSMVGAGPLVFALMGYVIAKAREGRVDLNPVLLGSILGAEETEVTKAIEKLCSPDVRSRNPEHEGRRLLHEGGYQYFVVSWQYYHEMKNEADKREHSRVMAAKKREEARRMIVRGEYTSVKPYETAEERAEQKDGPQGTAPEAEGGQA